VTDKQRVPDWRQLAAAQLNAPGTEELVHRFTTELSTTFSPFGNNVLNRVLPSVCFGVTTFPHELRRYYSYNNAHLISWIFALDELLDTCEDFGYVQDFMLLLNTYLACPVDEEFLWQKLNLTYDPAIPVPNLSYSLLQLAEAIHSLRRRLASEAQDSAGLMMFDRYLIEWIMPAMINEAKWRLGISAPPSFAQYLETATTSICGGLCVATLNAVLPHPLANWQATTQATSTMCRAVRLINDVATRPKDELEGKHNAVNLLALESDNLIEAESKVRLMIDRAAEQLTAMCEPFVAIKSLDDPLYVLNYYIFYSWVITEAMYSKGDFIASLNNPVEG